MAYWLQRFKMLEKMYVQFYKLKIYTESMNNKKKFHGYRDTKCHKKCLFNFIKLKFM